MLSAAHRDAAAPIPELNTTPLIDIMLVLLVMFIVTIPMQTHAVKLDLPTAPEPTLPVHPIRNLVEVTAGGTLLWNGVPVDRGSLVVQIRRSQQMRRIPELHLKPDPVARYEVVDQLLALIKREKVSRFGFIGNEAYTSV